MELYTNCDSTIITVREGRDIVIHLDYSSSNPIYLQIKENIKKLILSGGLQENESLPSVRTLASSLAINVNTVIRAYRELETEGYIYSMQGKGNFVSKIDDIKDKEHYLEEKIISLVKEANEVNVDKKELIELLNKVYDELECEK
jgi:GntR family transcriptional regulator